MNPLADSRWPSMETSPGFASPGWIDGARDARHDHGGGRQRGDRADARLNRQQVRIAAAVQRNGLDLLRSNDFAQVGCHGLHLRLGGGFGVGYRDVMRSLSDSRARPP